MRVVTRVLSAAPAACGRAVASAPRDPLARLAAGRAPVASAAPCPSARRGPAAARARTSVAREEMRADEASTSSPAAWWRGRNVVDVLRERGLVNQASSVLLVPPGPACPAHPRPCQPPSLASSGHGGGRPPRRRVLPPPPRLLRLRPHGRLPAPGQPPRHHRALLVPAVRPRARRARGRRHGARGGPLRTQHRAPGADGGAGEWYDGGHVMGGG